MAILLGLPNRWTPKGRSDPQKINTCYTELLTLAVRNIAETTTASGAEINRTCFTDNQTRNSVRRDGDRSRASFTTRNATKWATFIANKKINGICQRGNIF